MAGQIGNFQDWPQNTFNDPAVVGTDSNSDDPRIKAIYAQLLEQYGSKDAPGFNDAFYAAVASLGASPGTDFDAANGR